MQSDITIESADWDTQYPNQWIHIMLRLTNNGNITYNMHDVVLGYRITDLRPDLLAQGNTWWYNTHSPDWQYSYGSPQDIEISHEPLNGDTINLLIKIKNGLMYKNGGQMNIQFAVNKTDWSNFYELDDPSYPVSRQLFKTNTISLSTSAIDFSAYPDFGIYFDVDTDVINLDLSGGNPSQNIRIVREMSGLNIAGDDITEKSITLSEYKRVIWSTMERSLSIKMRQLVNGI